MKKIIDIQDCDRMRLSEEFIDPFKTARVPWGPLGEFTYRRTYSRRLDDGSSEEWWQTVRRFVEGCYTYQAWHCRRVGLPWSWDKAQESAQEMYRLAFSFQWLPPGRGLWACGTQYVEERGAGCLNNCAFVSTENIDVNFSEPFTFLMDFSMLGVGVGSDTRGAGKVVIRHPNERPLRMHAVPDTREGWVDLVRMRLDSYVGKAIWETPDYSEIRPDGSPIRGFGGTASGPEPLKRLIAGIDRVLTGRIGGAITSTDIVDIQNLIGVCVVAGNVRRSAEIMFGDPDDPEFLALKHPVVNGDRLASHGWASNNSVFARVGMAYDGLAERTAANGEPGYYWLDNAQRYGRMADPRDDGDLRVRGANPCSEQPLEHRELCCLVETFPSLHNDIDTFKRTLKVAYLYAKTITLLPTHNPAVNAVVMRNRRIGTSQSGIVDAMELHGRRQFLKWCDEGYRYLRDLDVIYSDWLCVPRSRRITSVKPSGTVSLLPGVSPGIHYPHAAYYFRTVRIAANSPLVLAMVEAGYRVEDDEVSAGTKVVYFPVAEPYGAREKHQVSMWEQLQNAADMQRWWADNMVSVTVTFLPREAEDIGRALQCFEDKLKSVSFLPIRDHGYRQAPYIAIEVDEWNEAQQKLRPVVWPRQTHEQDDTGCDGDRCQIGANGGSK